MSNRISSSVINSFPPIIGDNPHTLILGSMPGRASLEAQQYYAWPQNAFWPIMAGIFEFDEDLDYSLRLQVLASNGILLWDVLHQCERGGSSLDSAIDPLTEIPNDIPQLLSVHSTLHTLCFNGGKAWNSFRRHLLAQIGNADGYQFHQLPSTSPANARMSYVEKYAAWKEAIKP